MEIKHTGTKSRSLGLEICGNVREEATESGVLVCLSLPTRFDGLVGGVEILVEALCLAAGASSAFHPESAEEILDDLSRCLAIVRVVRGLRIGFRIKPLKQMVRQKGGRQI